MSIDHRVIRARCVLGAEPSELRIVPARLRIEDSRIAEVQEGDLGEDGPDVLTLDERYLVSPAFVNGHTHLSMAGFRGLGGVAALEGNVVEDLYYRIESSLEPETVRAFVRVGAYESLLHGVGLVWDHYYHGLEVAAALRDVGLAGVVAPTLQDVAGPGVKACEDQFAQTLAIDEDSSLQAAGIAAAFGPHATDTVSEALWRRVAETSAQRAIPVHAHLAQTFDELERAHERHGCSPAEWLQRIGALDTAEHLLLVHGVFLSEGDLARMDSARHTLGYCPFSQMQFCFPAAVKRWTTRELPWLVATDCVASNDSMNVQKELRLVAGLRGFHTTESVEYDTFLRSGRLLDAQLVDAHRRATFERHHQMADPSFLLSRVWSVPGRMHPRLPAGVLEAGTLANLVIWDLEHPAFWPADDALRALSMGDTSQAIDAMMVAGRWVSERGDHHRSLAQRGAMHEAVREAENRLRHHLQRSGIDLG